MKKFMIGMMMGVLVLATGTSANAATKKEVNAAADKLLKGCEKCVAKKKNVKVKITVKVKAKKKKSWLYDYPEVRKVETAAQKKYQAKYKNAPEFGISISDTGHTDNNRLLCGVTVVPKATYKKGKVTVTYPIKYKKEKETRINPKSQESYRYKVYQELKAATAGITDQKQLVWEVLKFVDAHLTQDANRHVVQDWKAIYEKRGYISLCQDNANFVAWAMKMAGVKCGGYADSREDNHAWNWIKINGKYYYFELADINGWEQDMATTPRYTNDETLFINEKVFLSYKEYGDTGIHANTWRYEDSCGKGKVFKLSGDSR